MLLLALLACGQLQEIPPSPAAPAAPGGLTYANAGQPFLLTYCTGCHAQTLSGDRRRGAPVGLDLDSVAGLRSNLGRVRARTVDAGDMPPGGGPTDAELARFAAWLDAGAPGVEASFPPVLAPDPALVQGYTTVSRVQQEGEQILLSRQIDGPQTDFREGIFAEERYEAREGSLFFLGSTRYNAEGGVEAALAFVSGLAIAGPAAAADVQTVEREDGATEAWSPVAEAGEPLDPRGLDPLAALTLFEEEGGARLGWYVSSTVGLVGGFQEQPDGGAVRWLRLSSSAGDTPDALFPLHDGDLWVERTLLEGAP